MSRTKKYKKTGCRAVDPQCEYCRGNRTFKKRKTEEHSKKDEEEYERAPVPWWQDEDLDD